MFFYFISPYNKPAEGVENFTLVKKVQAFLVGKMISEIILEKAFLIK
jgi:hypothetical protein